ncbi:MAG TPA: holo-ACP synthase [Puia sp.]|jgi:holo-[acyl-carrier protein] synthase|nr:holo-ACP synthase [Puia sp.]
MIIGIGCDVVNHRTTKLLKWETDIDLLKRFFSPKELNLYSTQKKLKFLAGRFAAKEAVLKCLGTGMQDGISLTQIQILETNYSQPEIKLIGKPKKISDNLGIVVWHVSISHSIHYSMAFVIAEGIKK